MSLSILDNGASNENTAGGPSDPTLSRMMAPGSAYWSRDHADHASAVDAVRTRHQQLSGEYVEPSFHDMPQNQSLSSRERRIAQLNAPDSPLWKKGTPEAAAALAELKQLLAAEPEAEAARENMTVQDLRDHFGLSEPDFAAPVLEQMYDSVGEAVFLDFSIANGYDTKLVTDLRDHYIRAASGTMGEITDDAVEEFHRVFEHRVSRQHREALVSWLRRYYGDAR